MSFRDYGKEAVDCLGVACFLILMLGLFHLQSVDILWQQYGSEQNTNVVLDIAKRITVYNHRLTQSVPRNVGQTPTYTSRTWQVNSLVFTEINCHATLKERLTVLVKCSAISCKTLVLLIFEFGLTDTEIEDFIKVYKTGFFVTWIIYPLCVYCHTN